MDQTSVYAIDVGRAGTSTDPSLGWAGLREMIPVASRDDQLEALTAEVAKDLRDGLRVALGFGAPGWVPVPTAEADLLRSRAVADVAPGGSASSWCGRSAVWGTARVLAQAPWALRRVRELLEGPPGPIATLDPDRWAQDRPLLVLEAHVAGAAKPSVGPEDVNPHAVDARIAVEALRRSLPDLVGDEVLRHPVHERDGEPFAVLGAALLHAGLSDDLRELRTAPLLVRPTRPTDEPSA